ncbi:MAG: CoA-binding protein [Chloroflexota bacterium]|nr:CoA-binding protein [Chloroflexota bacterium]MDE3101848.1 CoA-binding protein [Chloroflexota bacterium]
MAGLVNDFLSHARIAVVGVSREPKGHGANSVYRRLRSHGYSVFAVNPSASSVEGDVCYRDLASIPSTVDGVILGTGPARAEAIVRECHMLGIKRVWMHRGPVPGSVSPTAVRYCADNGIAVIAGGCPLMYAPTSDLGHRCMRWFLERSGSVPRNV